MNNDEIDDREEIVEDEVIEENSLNDKIKKLRGDLKICEQQKGEYLAGWQRARADFINARKEEERVRGEFTKYATEKILREVLKVADSLEFAHSLGEGGAEGNPIHHQLMDILKKEGVVLIEARGKPFNPMYHEAIEQLEVGEKDKDEMVIEELQKGYMLYDRVLRPSKVKVGIYKN